MVKFKVGDMIRSVTDKDTTGGISIGEVFQVTDVHGSTVNFTDTKGYARFRNACGYELATATTTDKALEYLKDLYRRQGDFPIQASRVLREVYGLQVKETKTYEFVAAS